MSTRTKTCALAVVGIVVACHSSPLPDSVPDAPNDETPAGSGGDVSSTAGSAGRDSPGQGGRAGQPSSGGGAPVAAGDTGAAGEQGGAGAGNMPNLPEDPFEGPSRCSSGRMRDANASEGPEMNPGFPCIFCHAASNSASGEGDAPIFPFAGTLYAFGHEPNSCIGGGDKAAEVVLNDAAGAELRATANPSGNFHLEDAVLTPPFSVKVLFEGRERAATTMHDSGDCNLCHTEAGFKGAPGRVVLP